MNKNTQFLKQLFFLLLISFYCLSCGEERYRLDANDRKIIDSVSTAEIEKLSKILSDSCQSNYNGKVKSLTDSLIEFQLKEIDKKLHQIQ
jgi:hypothetical protein